MVPEIGERFQEPFYDVRSTSVAGMMEEDFIAQASTVEMDIYFCGGYTLMTEHLLDGAQIGSSFEEMGGE